MIGAWRCVWCTGVLVLTACASTPPLDVTAVDRSLGVAVVVQRGPETIGRRILWGGAIVRSENRAQTTELEVLAYPLERNHHPNTGDRSLGRFIIERPGYVETADYAPGREVTVVGIVKGTRQGHVDRFPYQYPVIGGEQLHLWPQDKYRSGSGVHFGVGVGVGF